MITLLSKLKDNFNVVEVKAEFEAEGTRIDEAIRLKEIVDAAGLGLMIKIGGAEAIRDIFDAQLLDVSGLVAPMIESPYALRKYLDAIETFIPRELKNNIKFGMNIETIQAYSNLESIFREKGINLLSRITVGRVDLCLSLGISRNDINSERIYQITKDICYLARKFHFQTTIGGGIAVEALPFIKRLGRAKLLDRYETRKIVFEIPKTYRKAAQGILLANEFELLWLENKRNYYNAIYQEDSRRIAMLKKRLVLGRKIK